MDVERTMEWILEQQARTETRFEAWAARQATWEAKAEARFAKHEKEIAAIRVLVKAGMKMIVNIQEEQKAQRGWRKEMDEALKELAAAQAATQKSLQSFIESMRRGTNGRRRG